LGLKRLAGLAVDVLGALYGELYGLGEFIPAPCAVELQRVILPRFGI
jgi:hypothetical protein